MERDQRAAPTVEQIIRAAKFAGYGDALKRQFAAIMQRIPFPDIPAVGPHIERIKPMQTRESLSQRIDECAARLDKIHELRRELAVSVVNGDVAARAEFAGLAEIARQIELDAEALNMARDRV